MLLLLLLYLLSQFKRIIEVIPQNPNMFFVFMHFVTFNSLLHFLLRFQIFPNYNIFFPRKRHKVFSFFFQNKYIRIFNFFFVVPRALVEIDLEGIKFHLFFSSPVRSAERRNNCNTKSLNLL